MAGKEEEISTTRKVAGTVMEVGGIAEGIIGLAELSLPVAAVGGLIWLIGNWVKHYNS